ncbi:MAG: hypothetical protein KGR26_10270, partial [Cyanobacteria bacterium REEB65]|nr:hypothetical protein [Cyanobacteria bacterium REEB65]
MADQTAIASQATAKARLGAARWAGVVAFLVYFAANNGAFMNFDYHVWLADAFLHGRLDIVAPPPWLTEFARYHGHRYVFFGPVPALLLLPLVAVMHSGVNLARVSNVVGALDVALAWRLLERLGCSGRSTLCLMVLFAFGSVQFWESEYGNTWLFAQLCALGFLIAATLEVLSRRRGWLVGLLVGCAALSRESAALAFPFFCLLINHPRPDGQKTAGLLAGVAIAAGADGWYNWARFGNPIDNGYLYGNQTIWHPPFGSFSLHYVPAQLVAYFWRGPTFAGRFPFVALSDHGLSLLWTTPAYLYLVPAALALFRFRTIGKLWASRDGIVALAALATGALLVGLYLVYFWDGWRQFGSRYSLDYELFLMLPLALYLKDRLPKPFIALTAVSVMVNVWGVLYWRLHSW